MWYFVQQIAMAWAFLINFPEQKPMMNTLKKHSSQIIVHLLAWALFVFVSLFMFSRYYWKDNPFNKYVAILVIIVYLNNLVLLPFFIKKKQWYVGYAVIIGAISFYTTQLYCYVFAECGCSIMKCLSDYLWQTITPLIFFSFIWMLFRNIRQQEDLENIKKERTEMELKFLKSQIDPHVLFNNLNTIYSYSIEKPEQTPDLILMLSDNLKHVLYESNAEKVALKKELQFIDNYIEFQRIRTEGVKHINYSTRITDSNKKIAPLLLITIVENAFKHSSLNSNINIEIKDENGFLICECENDFEETSTNSETQNIGLKNLEKRLQLIYKNDYELKIDNTETFKVFLKLKL